MAKNYRYIGTSTNPKDAIFNQQYYDSLIDNRQYQDAYDYAMKYPMLDPMEQAEYKQHLKNMLREGRIVEAIYKNIDEAAYPAVDFRNLVMQPGGLEKLETGNTYANQFKTLKNELVPNENENQNKLIRRHYPKGTSFENLTPSDVAQLEKWINNYPRKIFGYQASEDLYQDKIKSLFCNA